MVHQHYCHAGNQQKQRMTDIKSQVTDLETVADASLIDFWHVSGIKHESASQRQSGSDWSF